MRLTMRLALLSAFLLLGISAGKAFCADGAESGEPSAPAAAEEMTPQTEMQWVWAEVVSVDPVTGQMTLKYLDYETDTEKEMVMTVNNQTAYENVKALVEIKPTDTVSIDYISTADGKNLARNVNVEKAEGIQPMPEETAKIPREEEKTPAEAQPAVAPAAQPAEAGQATSDSGTQGY
jgi:hypothetical protein